MSEPYIEGETLYKAFWTRTGLYVVSGQVLAAGAGMFLVQQGDSRHESLPQDRPDGWSRTKSAALEHLICTLGCSLRRAENDVLRIRARISSTKTMAGQLEVAAREGGA